MELTDPINIMKIIISLIEIAIEKTIYITKSENNELVFSLPLLLKVLNNYRNKPDEIQTRFLSVSL